MTIRYGIIKYMSSLGQRKGGVNKAPQILTDYVKSKCQKVTEYNIEPDHQISAENIRDQVSADCFSLSSFMKESLKNNDMTITFGGDHSLGIGSVEGVLSYDPQTYVVWIDAHADINTPERSLSGNMHGMPLAFNCNLTKNNLPWLNNVLDPSRLIYLGLRDVDDFEKEVIKEYNIMNYTAKETVYNLPDILKEIRAHIGKNPVHVSLDVDAFDPSVIPSTGTAVDGGLELDHFTKIMEVINERKKVRSIDIVELNPEIGTSEEIKRSIENSYKILDRIIV